MKEISPEIKELCINLNKQNASDKEIAGKLNIGRSSVYNILKEAKKEQTKAEDDEKNEFIRKKLSEIFTYENHTEKASVELIYDLRKIAQDSGSIDLWGFLDDIKIIFNAYYKYSDDTIKLFNFWIDISREHTFIANSFDMDKSLELIKNFIDREMVIENADEYLAEIEAKAELSLANTKEIWNNMQKKIQSVKKEAIKEVIEKSETLLKNSKEEYAQYQQKIDNAQERLKKLTSTENLMLQKIIQKSNEQKLQKALENNNELKVLVQKTSKKNQELKNALDKITHDMPTLIKAFEQRVKEVKEKNSLLESEIEEANQENVLLERTNAQINHLYPAEMENIKTEMENEKLQRSETPISQTPL